MIIPFFLIFSEDAIKKQNDLIIGLVVGLVGGLIVIVVIIVLLILWKRKKRRKYIIFMSILKGSEGTEVIF